MTREEIREYTLRISQANRSNLYVIMYEITGKYLDDAVAAYDAGDDEAFKSNMVAAQKGIAQLTASLNMNIEISGSLANIYNYLRSETAMAMILRDKERILKASEHLKKLKEAFYKAAENDKSSPVMGNTQEIYAGLTYGRNQLNENLTETSNRGYMV